MKPIPWLSAILIMIGCLIYLGIEVNPFVGWENFFLFLVPTGAVLIVFIYLSIIELVKILRNKNNK